MQLAWHARMLAVVHRFPLTLLVVACTACASSPRGPATERTIAQPQIRQSEFAPLAHEQPEHLTPDVSLEQRLLLATQSQRSHDSAELVEHSTPCALSINVTDQGGVVLVYKAAAGQEGTLRRAVRAMASRHNQHTVERNSKRGALAEVERRLVLPSVAIVETAQDGARVTLVLRETQRLQEFYEHIELHAPDLVPPMLLVAQRCPLNA